LARAAVGATSAALSCESRALPSAAYHDSAHVKISQMAKPIPIDSIPARKLRDLPTSPGNAVRARPLREKARPACAASFCDSLAAGASAASSSCATNSVNATDAPFAGAASALRQSFTLTSSASSSAWAARVPAGVS